MHGKKYAVQLCACVLLKPVVDPTQMNACISRHDRGTVENLTHEQYDGAEKTCSHCLQVLPAKEFMDAHKYAKDDDSVMYWICNVCHEQGYTPDSIEEIECRFGHQCGRDAFDKYSLINRKRRNMLQVCLKCRELCLCDACKERKDPDQFDKARFQNAKRRKTKCVCLECEAIGCSPKDCTIYECEGSRTNNPHKAGHRNFSDATLRRYRRERAGRRGRAGPFSEKIPFRCLSCEGETSRKRQEKTAVLGEAREDDAMMQKRQKKTAALVEASQDEPMMPKGEKKTTALEETREDEAMVERLLHKLRSKAAWRCTCKTTRPAPSMRAKSAIEGKRHDPKCMLQRTIGGERRWDGKNMGVTLAQLKYLADHNLW